MSTTAAATTKAEATTDTLWGKQKGRIRVRPFCFAGLALPALDELKSEAALHAQVPGRDDVVQR
jgi:hypothetical protein